MENGLNVYAVGRIARQLNITSQLVLKMAAELKLEPAITINDVPHFTRGDINTIRCRMSGEAANDEPNSP